MTEKTKILMILDASGSMSGLVADTVGGINTFIKEQKKLDKPADISILMFNSRSIDYLWRDFPLLDVQTLDEKSYVPSGNTPLYEAIGRGVTDLDIDMAKEPEGTDVVVVIITDGQENSSQGEFKDRHVVKAMLEKRQKDNGWSVVYLGANLDAKAEASLLGINLNNAAQYNANQAGTEAVYSNMSEGLLQYRGLNAEQRGVTRSAGLLSEKQKVNIAQTGKKSK